MHNKFFGVAAIFLITWQQTEAQTFSKTQLAISPELDIYANVEWIDFDGDYDLDIVELYSDPSDDAKSFVKIYQNNNGSFSQMPNVFNGTSIDPRQYDFKDHDADGDVDMLFVDNEGIKIAVNNSNFSFAIQYTSITNPNNAHGEIHWQDLDGDQDLDIVFGTLLYLNVSGTYYPALHNMPHFTGNRSWADVNHDGYLDMVATKGQSSVNPLFLFVNEGDGLFREEAQLFPQFQDSDRTQWLDADADDDMDLFISVKGGKCALLRNTISESGGFDVEPAVSFRNLSNSKADVGDINLDGLPDIIISGQDGPRFETYLYLNSSDGSEIEFVETDLQINPYLISNFDLVDADADFDLDLFIMGWGDDWYSIRVQDVYKINPGNTRLHPAVPDNLTNTVEEHVTLSWDHDDDEGTVYFKTAIKLNGIPLTSGSSLDNGTPLMADLTNLQTAQQLTLQNLSAGSYEWRVLAIDHANRTSGFSLSSSFTVIEGPTNLVLDALAYNKVKLDWEYTGLATGFSILRRSSNGALSEIGSTNVPTKTFTDTNVPPNEHVEYVVKAISAGAHSAPSNTVSYYSSQFEEISVNTAGLDIVSGSGLSADFDSDADYDLGFVGWIENLSAIETSSLLANDGAGLYSINSFLSGSEDFSDVIAKDMDNDGDIDVCVIEGGIKAVVYEKAGGSFVKSFETTAYQEISQMASEDMNNDGLPDLMIKHPVGNSPGNVPSYDLLFQTSAGDFVNSNITFLQEMNNTAGLGDFHLADLNNDGFTDVVFTGAEYNVEAKLFLNLKGNAFKEAPFNLTLLTNPIFFDFNGDSKLDIMQRGFQVLYLYNGLGDAQFAEPQEISIAGLGANESIHAKIADMDFNGWPDLIVNGRNNTALLYNTGQGNFVRADYEFAADEEARVILTDMEGDGDLDFVKLGNDGSHHGINYYYKSRSVSTPGQNAAPAAPASLQVSRSGSATTLSWMTATDDTTPLSMISYHVQLRDGNGKYWVHPETNPAGTFRRRLAYGNAGFRTTFTINNLPAGHYTAYVQSVDATFKLSALSTALVFDIAAGPSTLVTERILLNKVKLTWADGPFNGTTTVVQRKSLNSEFKMIAELPANATTFTDEGLAYDSLYTYQVYEKNSGTITAGSNTVVWNTTLLVLEQSTITNVTSSLDVGDYTGDGEMDMLIFGGRIYNSNIIDMTSALLEKTSGGWIQQNAGTATISTTGTSSFYDVNGDYRLDIFQHGYFNPDGEYKTHIFLNNGNKTFTSTTDSFTENGFTTLETWDYDRDNDLDFYVSKPTEGTSLLKNQGDGIFKKDAEFNACCNERLLPGDFDNDGDEDIVHFDRKSNYFMLSLNKDGAMRPNVNLQINNNGLLHKLDYNGDGWLDLLVISTDNYAKSKLYKNQGPDASGNIQFEVTNDDLPIGEVVASFADYDHDGDLDIFFTGKPCVMYNNEGNDVFRKTQISNFRVGGNNSRWIDFDADGDLDLFIMGYFTVDNVEGVDQPYGYVLNNKVIVSGKGIENQPPAAPTNLTYFQDTDGLHLSWSDQPDDHTPLTALTHDVVIYKGGKTIVKGSFNPSTGMRYSLHDGRSSETLLLDSLQYGSYTWKVQAVDQTFKGSPLSAAGEFVFLPQAPVMNDTVIYKCDRQIVLTADGTAIEWYSDKALTTKVADGTYSPQTSQVVYVTQTLEGMRGVGRAVDIKIHDRPPAPLAAIGNYFYCENELGNSAYVLVSGNNIRWYEDADKKISAGSGNQLSILLSEQNYYATQTIAACESLPTVVAVKPVIINADISFEDDRIYTAEQNGSFYQWYKNNFTVPNGNSYFIDGANAGDVYKVYIEKGGCSETSDPAVITGIEFVGAEKMRVFPNPSPDNFTVEAPGKGVLKIHDVTGRVLYEKTITDSSEKSVLISSVTWGSGVYFISLTSGQQTLTQRVVVK